MKETTAMSLGLAHSLSRYKLKFSPDKVDTMIVQAISLLDDLDKELNNYVMRCREWYGWHFPELGKIVTDNTAYAKTVKMLGKHEYVIRKKFLFRNSLQDLLFLFFINIILPKNYVMKKKLFDYTSQFFIVSFYVSY